MKFSVGVVLLLVGQVMVLSQAAFVYKDSIEKKSSAELMDFQLKIFNLFRHIYTPEWNPGLMNIGKSFDIFNQKYYTSDEPVNYFKQLYDKGLLLKKGLPFSLYVQFHKNEAITLVALLNVVKTPEDYFKLACWAKLNLNEELVMYAILVQLIHSNENEIEFDFPAPYEINPYKFFQENVIREAHKLKMQGYEKWNKTKYGCEAIIDVKKIDSSLSSDAKMNYFREDIDWNTYYYYYALSYPNWISSENIAKMNLYGDRRGELFLYEHQQLLARYNLELISNGEDVVNYLNVKKGIFTPYYPFLATSNGPSMLPRPYDFYHNLNEKILKAEEYERRLNDILDRGIFFSRSGAILYLSDPNSINDYGNIIEHNQDSNDTVQFYDYIYDISLLLGGDYEFSIDLVQTTAMMHPETRLRDPLYYQIIQRIVGFYYKYKNYLGPYSMDELNFNGVNIKGIKVSALETFYKDYDVDITNAVFTEYKMDERDTNWLNKEKYLIKARTPVLAHKPFHYDLAIESEKSVEAVVRAFIGPAYVNDAGDAGFDWDGYRSMFFQFDYFKTKLSAGINKIVRKSSEFNGLHNGLLQFEHIAAMFGNNSYERNVNRGFCGFPERLILPRGDINGAQFFMYFIVTPYDTHRPKVTPIMGCGIGTGSRYIDTLALGFPFDRPIIDPEEFFVTNSKYIPVTITFQK